KSIIDNRMVYLSRSLTAALRSLAVLVALSLPAAPAGGQVVESQSVAESGEELTVYLMTMGPGSAFWERFGHNAIWIRDDLRRTNVAYNYGMFSFDQENFF